MTFLNGQNVIKSVVEAFNTENDPSNCLPEKVESLVKDNQEKREDATPKSVHVSNKMVNYFSILFVYETHGYHALMQSLENIMGSYSINSKN